MFDVDLGPVAWLMLVVLVTMYFGLGFVSGVLPGLILTRDIKDKKKRLFKLLYWGVAGGLIMVAGVIFKEKFVR